MNLFTKKEVEIYVRVLQTNIGQSIIVYRMGKHEKVLHLEVRERTCNRSIIASCTIAIAGLKEPCAIKLYTNKFWIQIYGA